MPSPPTVSLKWWGEPEKKGGKQQHTAFRLSKQKVSVGDYVEVTTESDGNVEIVRIAQLWQTSKKPQMNALVTPMLSHERSEATRGKNYNSRELFESSKQQKIDLASCRKKVEVKLTVDESIDIVADEADKSDSWYCRHSLDEDSHQLRPVLATPAKGPAASKAASKKEVSKGPPTLQDLMQVLKRDQAKEHEAENKAKRDQERFESEANLTHAGKDLISADGTETVGVPFRPSIPKAEVVLGDPTQLKISWAAADEHGSTIKHYELEQCVDLSQKPGTNWQDCTPKTAKKTEVTVKNLDGEQTYVFRVRAVNKMGNGPFSGISEPIRPADAAPTSVKKRKAEQRSSQGAGKDNKRLKGLPVAYEAFEIEMDTGSEKNWVPAVMTCADNIHAVELSKKGEPLKRGVDMIMENYRSLADPLILVGAKVAIITAGSSEHQPGTIEGFRNNSGKHQVQFDNLQGRSKSKWLDLAASQWQFHY